MFKLMLHSCTATLSDKINVNLTPRHKTMEALKLQKKYPEVSRDEMFELINCFKCVS
jgi:hypothetical protein